MKTYILKLFVIAACFLLASCASLIGPREIDIPLVKLQQSVDKKFPLQNKYLSMLDISLSRPQLILYPETNRIGASVALLAAPIFLRREWKGGLSFSGTLQFDAARSAVVLADVRIDDVRLDGVDATSSQQISKVSGLLSEQLQNQVVLYTFKPDELRYAATDFVVSRIVIKPDAIEVSFEPKK